MPCAKLLSFEVDDARFGRAMIATHTAKELMHGSTAFLAAIVCNSVKQAGLRSSLIPQEMLPLVRRTSTENNVHDMTTPMFDTGRYTTTTAEPIIVQQRSGICLAKPRGFLYTCMSFVLQGCEQRFEAPCHFHGTFCR